MLWLVLVAIGFAIALVAFDETVFKNKLISLPTRLLCLASLMIALVAVDEALRLSVGRQWGFFGILLAALYCSTFVWSVVSKSMKPRSKQKT